MVPPVITHRPRGFHTVKNHPLSGITFPQWARLLLEHGDGIEVHRYWPRLAFLSAMSLFNSAGSLADSLLFGRAIARQELNPEPVFILGHPRTGTTHLFNLMSTDDRVCPKFQTLNPEPCNLHSEPEPSTMISLPFTLDPRP